MKNVLIIIGANMKKFLLLLCFASFLFALKSVPRTSTTSDDKATARTEVVQSSKTKKDDETKRDRFQDADSNSVNDHREDDFQRIKQLKTKYRPAERTRSSSTTKKVEKPTQSSKKTVQPAKVPERKSDETKKSRQ